jgi:large subunit ribosomal protein L4
VTTSVPLRTTTGSTSGEVELSPAWFAGKVNVPLMHQVVVAQMAARRSGTSKVKTRAEVSGGGRKPYKQKGTGRARQGSIRAPHYVGGGVTHGPVPRDYSKKVPKKVRAAALRGALSDRAGQGKVAVFESLTFEEPKTKAAASLLRDAQIEGTVLIVLGTADEVTWRSFRNLTNAHVITVDQLNTYDILARDWLVLDKAAVEAVNARPAPSSRRKDQEGAA